MVSFRFRVMLKQQVQSCTGLYDKSFQTKILPALHLSCVYSQARGEVPRLPNGFPEKSSRPDRPRARDRPKPRRRPRPREAGDTTARRSRSAPAQSSPAVPQPPTHTAHHEGFLFRKLDIESLKKSTNRWVFSVAIMSIIWLGRRRMVVVVISIK